MKTCINCGLALDDDIAYCPKCGTKCNDGVENESYVPDSNENQPADSSKQPTSYTIETAKNENTSGLNANNIGQPKKNAKKLIIGALIVLLCIFGYFIINNATATVTSLSVIYVGDTEVGTVLDSNNKGFIVKEVYSNGREKEVDGWRINTPYKLAPDTVSTVHILYDDWDVTCDVACSTVIDKIEAEYKGSTKPGTEITKDDIVVTGTYSNGSTATVKAFSLDGKHILKAGETESIVITYHEKECTLNVQGDALTKPVLKDGVIDCTAEEYIDYLRSESNKQLVVKESLINEEDDGTVSNVYELNYGNELEGNLLIVEKDNKITLMMISMAEGKNDIDMYTYAFHFSSLIDDAFKDDDIRGQFVEDGKVEHNGLSVWNSTGITNGRYSCMIAPAGIASNVEEAVETENQLNEEEQNGFNTNESDWSSWTSSHTISLYNFMAASSFLDLNWTLSSNGDSKDKISYIVDDKNERLDYLYLMYGVESQRVTYVSLYTDDVSVFESNEYKDYCRKLMQAYTSDYDKDDGISLNVTEERASEIINYIIDNQVEHCLVDGMKIRGLFSDEEELYGITIGY